MDPAPAGSSTRRHRRRPPARSSPTRARTSSCRAATATRSTQASAPRASSPTTRYDLLLQETRDALGNRVTVGERDVDRQPLVARPTTTASCSRALVTDPNRNRRGRLRRARHGRRDRGHGQAASERPSRATRSTGFDADLTAGRDRRSILADPHGRRAAPSCGDATTRIVYDLDRVPARTGSGDPQPAVAATLARETHDARPGAGQQASDPASASPTPTASAARSRRRSRPSRGRCRARCRRQDHRGRGWPAGDDADDISPRWVGSGWTIFNNKGKPVRQYEPFFTDTHRFEFDVRDRRQPGALLRPGRARRRHAAPQPHLGEGGLRPVAAGDLGRQRHRPDRRSQRPTPTSATSSAALPDADYLPTLARAAQSAARSGRQRAGRGRARRAVHARHADGRARSTRWAAPFLTVAHNRFERDSRGAIADESSTHPRRARHRRQPARGRSTRNGPRRHALRLRHARQPHPPGQHGGGRALDAERRRRQADPRLGQPRPPLPHGVRRAAPAGPTFVRARRPTAPEIAGPAHRSYGESQPDAGGRATCAARSVAASSTRRASSRSDALRLQGQPAAQPAASSPATTRRRSTGRPTSPLEPRDLREQHPLRRAQPPDHGHRRLTRSVVPPPASTRPTCWSGWSANLRGAQPVATPFVDRHRLRRQGPAHADRLRQRRRRPSYDVRPADLPPDATLPTTARRRTERGCRTCTTPTTRPATSPTSRTTRSRRSTSATRASSRATTTPTTPSTG